MDLRIQQRMDTRWTLTLQVLSVLDLKAHFGTPVMGPVMIRAGKPAGIAVKGLPVHKRARTLVGVRALTLAKIRVPAPARIRARTPAGTLVKRPVMIPALVQPAGIHAVDQNVSIFSFFSLYIKRDFLTSQQVKSFTFRSYPEQQYQKNIFHLDCCQRRDNGH